MVDTSQPSVAAVTTCIGWRSGGGEHLGLVVAQRVHDLGSTAVESTEMSSTRPMKHET